MVKHNVMQFCRRNNGLGDYDEHKIKGTPLNVLQLINIQKATSSTSSAVHVLFLASMLTEAKNVHPVVALQCYRFRLAI